MSEAEAISLRPAPDVSSAVYLEINMIPVAVKTKDGSRDGAEAWAARGTEVQAGAAEVLAEAAEAAGEAVRAACGSGRGPGDAGAACIEAACGAEQAGAAEAAGRWGDIWVLRDAPHPKN